MISNQTLTILIILGVLITLIGWFLSSFTTIENSDFLFRIGLWLIEVPGMFLLLSNGTFLKTRYSRIAMGLTALMIIGVLFKIMHWSFQNILLLIGCIGIVFSYLLHFVQKPIKKRLDYLKLAWVIVKYIGAILFLSHVIGKEYQILTTVLMILALMDYMLPRIKNKTLFD
ncbi:GldL-related protein [Aquimarina megaterium]|uniref:GldL-related protein n=1 Tax=Aquimarina megaterium TaxID=1443666 RepID=UPI000472ADE3|nr:hypothetical protein [Aquimarina megaterium]